MITGKDDDAASIREDSFLAELVPQAAEQLAEQHAGDYDAEDGRARFQTWLAGHTERPVAPTSGEVQARTRHTRTKASHSPGTSSSASRHSVAMIKKARPAPPADGQLCTLFAVDIAGFTEPHRDDDIRLYLHEELYRLLEKAFDGLGITWAECFHEDRGDGVLTVVPPGVASTGIIDPLPERLRSLIRRHNRVYSDAARMQLRAAVHIGPVEHDGHAFVGSDINLLFRMLEARPLKRALAGSGAELALVVSDDVYRGLVCRYPSRVSPDAFKPVRFQVKDTRALAWTYLPGTEPMD